MRADEKLEDMEIEFEKIVQDNPTEDCDDAARERGLETSQIVKSLIVEREGDIVHACIPGDRKLSESKFGEHRLISPEESKELTGLESGTVHPLATDLKHFVDERVLEKDKVSHTAGTKTEAVIYPPEHLIEALEITGVELKIGDFVVSNKEDIEELEKRGIEEKDAKYLAESGHRKIFMKLSEDYPAQMVYDLIREMERDGTEFEESHADKILREAESQTHMQKMVQNFAENGEIETSDDEFNLDDVVEEVIASNRDAVEDYNEGRDSALNYLLGQVMQETSGRADGGEAREMLVKKLDE